MMNKILKENLYLHGSAVICLTLVGMGPPWQKGSFGNGKHFGKGQFTAEGRPWLGVGWERWEREAGRTYVGLHGKSLTSYKLHVGEDIESGPSTASGFSVLPAPPWLLELWVHRRAPDRGAHLCCRERRRRGRCGRGGSWRARLGRKPT